jgi:hypothetical protein
MCRQIHVLKAWPQIKLPSFGAIAHLRHGAAFSNVEAPTSEPPAGLAALPAAPRGPRRPR